MSTKLNGFFPLLTDPFPVPDVLTTTVPKKGKVGAGISDRFQEGVDRSKSFPHHVVIARLSDESPFQGTAVTVGQQVMAVGGKHVVTALQGAKDIRESVETLTLTTAKVVTAPYCRHFAIKLSPANPGVSFAGARNNTLVQVSLIYKDGPFKGFLNVGDIILSINGKVVSTPEDAMEELKNSVDKEFATIYLVDIHALRRSLTHQVMSYFAAANPKSATDWKQVSLKDNGRSNEVETGDYRTKGKVVVQEGSFSFRVAGKVLTNGLVFEQDSMKMKDTEPYLHLVAQSDWGTLGYENPSLFYKGKYRTMVIPFIGRFNALLDESLGPLRETVGVEVWRQHTGYVPPPPPPKPAPAPAPVPVPVQPAAAPVAYPAPGTVQVQYAPPPGGVVQQQMQQPAYYSQAPPGVPPGQVVYAPAPAVSGVPPAPPVVMMSPPPVLAPVPAPAPGTTVVVTSTDATNMPPETDAEGLGRAEPPKMVQTEMEDVDGEATPSKGPPQSTPAPPSPAPAAAVSPTPSTPIAERPADAVPAESPAPTVPDVTAPPATPATPSVAPAAPAAAPGLDLSNVSPEVMAQIQALLAAQAAAAPAPATT